MGEVYRALDTASNATSRSRFSPNGRRRTRRRGSASSARRARLRRLSHPAIVTIHEFTVTETLLFAVMELLEERRFARGLIEGPLGWKPAVEIAAAVANGLAAAHAKDVIHRDLKPENISFPVTGPRFSTSASRVLAACAVAAGESETLAGTLPGIVLGTLGYMSPEQLKRPGGRRAQRRVRAGLHSLRDGLRAASICW